LFAPTLFRNVRSQGQSRKHVLALSFSGFDPRADIRAFAETARGIPRSFAGTETFEQSRRERKNIEMRFAREALSKARST